MERVSDNIRKWSGVLKNVGLVCTWVYNLLVAITTGEPILYIVGIIGAGLISVVILIIYYIALGLAEIVDNTESTKIDLSKLRSAMDNKEHKSHE